MAMAIATCTCEHCGKKFEKSTVKRNCREADSWIAWAEKNITICDDCLYAERKAEADNISRRAVAAGLPELTGSERQITWGQQIRYDFAETVTRFWQDVENGKYGDTTSEQAKASIERTKKVLNYIFVAQTSASWWIDNRDMDVRAAIRRNFKDAEKGD